jgi:transcriptional regulator with XRE-family HTH domain
MTQDALCRSIGIGGRRAVDLRLIGLKALDLYRVCQIADRLDVSLDWLLGRSEATELPETARRQA